MLIYVTVIDCFHLVEKYHSV